MARKFDVSIILGVVDKASSKFAKIQTQMNKVGLAFAGVAAASAAVVLKLTNIASKAEETGAKFGTVFENQIEQATQWSRELVKSYGVSTEESRRFLSSIQDLLVPMGMQSDLAGKLSNEIVKLSVDLGSFNNMPTEKVMLDIQSALVGNFETMKKYGVVLNATRVEQHIMNQNLVESKKDITQAMKAQAAYELIVNGSEAALGDFNRTSEGYANQVKIMNARIADLLVNLGDKFLPIMTKFVGIIVDDVLPSFEVWIDNFDLGSNAAEDLGNSLKFIIDIAFGLVKVVDILADGLAGLGLAMVGQFGAAKIAFKEMQDKFVEFGEVVGQVQARTLAKTITVEREKSEIVKTAIDKQVAATEEAAVKIIKSNNKMQDTISSSTADTFEGVIKGTEKVGAIVPSIFGNIGNEIISQMSRVLASKAVKGVLNLFTGGVGGTALGLFGFANGVENFGGGAAVVGERGREIVNLPRGSNVIPNARTERILAGGKGTTLIISGNTFAGAGGLDDLVDIVEETILGRVQRERLV